MHYVCFSCFIFWYFVKSVKSQQRKGTKTHVFSCLMQFTPYVCSTALFVQFFPLCFSTSSCFFFFCTFFSFFELFAYDLLLPSLPYFPTGMPLLLRSPPAGWSL
uniref:T. congolense-specific, cell surface-expressed gene family n=1 Tax=Trypanosoma congolense (strain IL3000) TaxID=1068625 RepID=G0UPS5_TRYCI|nr:hypothetical protein, unlikely [Trypanosoma congolense IL3000]